LTLQGKKPLPRAYPKRLRTLGDHLRKRRLDLKLLQREAAERFGVDKTTIYLWESNRVKPSLATTPKIIEFLGYDPQPANPESLGEKICNFRRIHGLSQKKLARLLQVDQSSIGNWERGEHQPSEKLHNKLTSFIASLYHPL
jgi:DNA-binding XRE family transcriptional regulator